MRSHARKHADRRIVVLTIFLLLAFGAVVIRLCVVSVFSGSYYRALAEDQYSIFKKLLPNRGEIKIHDNFSGVPQTLATNISKDLVFAVPKDVTDPKIAAEKLAPVLAAEVPDLESKLSDKGRNYIVLKRQLSDEQEQTIKNLHLTGIQFEPEVLRFYPEKDLLAHVLGFVGYRDKDKVGLYGLEKSFETELAGRPGSLHQEKDTTGAWIFGGRRDLTPARDGDTLILTIDRSIQFKVQTVLEATVTKHLADSGCVIVMDPKTGGILAMATYPTFDPNAYGKVTDPGLFSNSCTMDSYEPGSVFKAMTMAAALDAGKISPDTTYVDPGTLTIDGHIIKNSDGKAHGKQTMTQALEQSLNTGAIFAKNQIGNELFLKYVKKFGFGKKTGVELPEAAGNLDNLKGNISVNYATASFGQGISVTPLQLVAAYGTLANKGVGVVPHIVETRLSPEGKAELTETNTTGPVVSPQAAASAAGMLVSVVENGHGKRAGVAGYYVAGKTGTAQVARKDGRGYEANNNIGSFIGFAPVDDPRFVMLVRINHPRTVQFAESTAAPAFGELAQFILNYYNIPPTRK